MELLNSSLVNKTALVTGAGSGIGKATAKLLAQAGASVALVGTTLSKLKSVEDDILAAGGSAFSIEADIGCSRDVQPMVSAVIERWGRLDIVHHNAGINGVWAPLEKLQEDEWDETLRVNLKGTYLVLRECIPHLKKRGGSAIVTSSVNGTRMFSNTGATAYACSKAAQLAMVKMLALEWARDHVRVNAICPGAIDSEIHDETEQRDLESVREPVEFPAGMIPLKEGRNGTAEEVARLVLFLSSDAASHITGTEIYIDGAQSLLQG